MKTRLIAIAAVFLAISLLIGCSQKHANSASSFENNAGSGQPRIAVVLKGMDQEYFKLEEKGAEQAFKDLDVEGAVLAAPTQTESEKLINILEDLLSQKPDALVFMPSTEAAVPLLERYQQDNIPVVLIDTNLDWDGKTAYIGTDNYTAGQEAGKFLASRLSKGDKVAVLEGVSGTEVSEERTRGVKDLLKAEGIKVAASQAADFDRVKAVTVMENILTANPDIKGVFAANDAMALGALQAADFRNTELPIIGIDGTTDALSSIAEGGVTATVEQRPYDMAYKGVENALKAIKGEKVEKNIASDIGIITEETAADKLQAVNDILDQE
ncbi:sugar ABC transporter substrate-binding protein [Bacillus xiapuensis]|uniref:sugar ABC transporter substrate-binding protein n=1 Tax=Bacillus xiapuensis TaxID=2014075 RepID=UPI0012FD85CC|nr:sugar ABC transporter substrate-binding protein [Bacillus xiapuensis]